MWRHDWFALKSHASNAKVWIAEKEEIINLKHLKKRKQIKMAAQANMMTPASADQGMQV